MAWTIRRHVRSHDAATCCRANVALCKPRRRPRKMAEMAVLRVFFEHLYTDVNGDGQRDINLRDSSAIPPIVAHLCFPDARCDDTRQLAAPAVHRSRLPASLIIHDEAGAGS